MRFSREIRKRRPATRIGIRRRVRRGKNGREAMIKGALADSIDSTEVVDVVIADPKFLRDLQLVS